MGHKQTNNDAYVGSGASKSQIVNAGRSPVGGCKREAMAMAMAMACAGRDERAAAQLRKLLSG